MSLKDQVAFITGAAHGQGRATALRFAEEGCHVIGFDLAKPLTYPGYKMGNENELQSLKKECEAKGVRCLVYQGDVRNATDIKHAVEDSFKSFKKIDILFNNAGICAYGLAEDLEEHEFDAMIDINLKGPWLVAKHIIPYMKRVKKGVIINNASIASHRGMARLSHYAASKWGLTGLTKSWAIELAPFQIRVLSIHPTGVDTPMNDGLAYLENATPQEIAERSAGNLLNVPWIESKDVAEAVIFLASDRARYVTGSQFILDAGLLSR